MPELTHIGLDVHKETIAVAVLRPGTSECDECVIANTPAALRKLLPRYPDRAALRTCYETGPNRSVQVVSCRNVDGSRSSTTRSTSDDSVAALLACEPTRATACTSASVSAHATTSRRKGSRCNPLHLT